MRKILQSCALLSIFAISSVSAQEVCKFQNLQELKDYQVKYEGQCQDGKATGLGILIARAKDKKTTVFYGEFKDATPVIGTLDTEHGYIGGSIKDLKIQSNDNRAQLIQAFDKGSLAAKQVAQIRKDKGDTAGYNHYMKMAKNLDEQLD